MSLRLPQEEYSDLCAKVLFRDGHKCRHCGLRSNLHVHHIIFRSQQGPDADWNLIVLCNDCHDALHRRDLTLLCEDDVLMSFGNVKFWSETGWRPN
jgi:5-methylcytosine-specific restriction endonuclease McrA